MRLQWISRAWMTGRRLRHGGIVAILTTLALAGGTQVAAAVSSPPPPPNPANPYADDKYVPREMKRQLDERKARKVARGSDKAKAERRASRSKYKDKSKHEALAIARAKFDKLFAMPAWAGLDLEPGQRVKDYIDDFQALLQVGDEAGETAVVQSTLPLLNADGQPTDLALEPQGDGFAPKAAEVELDIPADVGDGITLGGGKLIVTPVLDAGTDAVETDDKVFYANAQTDTDILVVPTVRGVETFHQLRSADSPEELSFDLDVPGGATLRFGSEPGPDPEDRGVEVVSPGGEVIAKVSPPAAWDADQEPVDVDYVLDGNRVTMKVAHRDEDVAYPVMVDPEEQIEDFRHWATGNRDTYGWQFGSWGGCQWNGYFGGGWWTYGFIAYHNNGVWCNDGEWAEWKWQAPRMSYIYRAEFHYQNHPYRYTCMINGLWAPWAGNWDGGWAWVHCGDLWNHGRGHCPISNNCDWNNGAPSNVAVWKVQAQYSGPRNPGAWGELGGAAIFLRDRDNPVIDSTGQNTDARWYRSGTMTVAPRAHDDGLGMNKFQLYIPGFVDDYRRHPCIRSRCPGSWSLPNDGQGIFSYNIPDIPNGINSVTLNARDALDKITGSSWSLNVDDEIPYLNVYGDLREAVNTGTWAGARTLSINSHDNITPYTGANSTARSGITAVDIYVDNVKKHSQTQMCFANCRLDFNWTMYSDEYAPGGHDIRVVARDGAGNERSSSTWRVYTQPSSPVTEEKDPEVDDGSSPTITGASLATRCLDPSLYCGQNDSTNPAHNEASAESPLSTPDAFGNPTTAPAARDRWGYAGQKGDEFDRPFVQKLFDRPGVKRARVIVPWDVLLRAEGLPKPGSTTGERVGPTYGWWAGPIGGTRTWDSRTISINPRPLAQYDRFMERANAYGWEVMISFGSTDAVISYGGNPEYKLGSRHLPHTYDPANPNDPYGYLYNVKRLLDRWRLTYPNLRIQHLSAFNEPNHDAYSPSGRLSYPHLGDATRPKYITPEQMQAGAKWASAYYNELDNYCGTTRSCQVLAGELVDRKDMSRYFPYYVGGLNRRPPRWAFHPYLAGARYIRNGPQSDWDGVFKWFNSETKNAEGGPHPQIWITEVGPLYSGSNGNNNNYTTGVTQLQAQMKLTLNSRITRFYYYSAYGGYKSVNGGPNTIHDSGFIDPSKDFPIQDSCSEPGGCRWTYPKEADRIRPSWCEYGKKTNPAFASPVARYDGPNRGDNTFDGWPACS